MIACGRNVVFSFSVLNPVICTTDILLLWNNRLLCVSEATKPSLLSLHVCLELHQPAHGGGP